MDPDLAAYLSSGCADPPNATNCSASVVPTGMTRSADSTQPRGGEALSPYATWQMTFIAVICSFIIVGTVIGNVLVCTAVSIVRKLRTPSNLLIVSLAVSDLLVALLDMPFATAYEVMGRWVFGQTVCDIWTSLDVLLCTASILNLCMISIDRYFVITRPFQYAMKRTPVRMLLMIAAVWTLSAIISIPPLFGWRADPKYGLCIVSQAIGYQFYATIGAFYLPLTVMIIIYTRIYMVSYRIAQAEASARPPAVIDGALAPAPATPRPASDNPSESTTPLRGEIKVIEGPKEEPMTGSLVEENHNMHNGKQTKHHPMAGSPVEETTRSANTSAADPAAVAAAASKARLFLKSRASGQRLASSNERKATKTLGVIMGAFTACWLPFFILALIKPFCPNPETCIPHWLNSLFLWLGYTNSFLNPIIYARFNRDFRTPFKHILQCRCRDINLRLRSENFAEQFGPAECREVVTQRNQSATAETFVRFSCQGRAVVKLK